MLEKTVAKFEMYLSSANSPKNQAHFKNYCLGHWKPDLEDIRAFLVALERN